ncbi:hypothetical protein HN827_03055 [archaeon]|nr:hypothetical protein [archaeon]MBT6822144.1 hypothetical protein [archaeon]MBT7391781.1 hypothetical protein [archaeon]
MTKKESNEVKEKIIDLILNRDDFDYKSLIFNSKKGKSIIKEIEDFVSRGKKVKKSERIKNVVFNSTSNVGEENINDIVDAFVNMRNGATLTTINGGSLSGVLVMFNKWINLELNAPGQNQLPSVIVKAANEYHAQLNLEENLVNSVSIKIPKMQGDLYIANTSDGSFNIYSPLQNMQEFYNPDFSLTGPVKPYEDRTHQGSVYMAQQEKGVPLYNSETRFTGPTGNEKED